MVNTMNDADVIRATAMLNEAAAQRSMLGDRSINLAALNAILTAENAALRKCIAEKEEKLSAALAATHE